MIRKRPLCIACLIFMVGIWVMGILGVGWQQEPAQNPVILEYLEAHPQRVRIYGTIYKRTLDGSAIYLKNSYLQTQSEIQSLENVKVYMEEMDDQCKIGSGVLVVGKMQKVSPPTNPGQFDSPLYYKTQHIYYRMFNGKIEKVDEVKNSYREVLAQIRDSFDESLNVVTKEYAPVYQAMLLGDKSQMEDEVKDRYQMAGLLHMLAISGLHLTLLGMGCFCLLQRAGASIPLAGTLAVFLLFSYGILTGEGVATMRALCMYVLIMGAKLTGRTYDMLSALSLSAILLLIDNPYFLYYSGFQMSFGCICAIGIVLPKLRQLFALDIHAHRKRKWWENLRETLLASAAIQITTLPLTLYWFFEYPVYGMILNLIAIPTLSVVLVAGIAGGIAGMISSGIGVIFILPGNIFLWLYDCMGKLVGYLPMTTWVAGQPKIWQILLYYGILTAFLKIATCKELQKKFPKYLPRFISIPILCTSLILLGYRSHSGLTITCLDVGQGDGIFVQTPQGITHMIDGGSSNISKVGRYRLLPFLKSQGVSTVDYLWISHTDADHTSGIIELLELQKTKGSSIEIKHLMLPNWRTRTEEYEKLMQLAQEAGVQVLEMLQGDVLKEGELQWRVLSPVEGQGDDANESSQVLLVEYGDFQGLFTGDIGIETEGKIANQLEDVDFLKVAHHGSKNSTGDSFLRLSKPEVAAVSCSSTNRYGHPHPDTLGRLETISCRVWCTKDVGAITVKTDGTHLWMDGYLSD